MILIIYALVILATLASSAEPTPLKSLNGRSDPFNGYSSSDYNSSQNNFSVHFEERNKIVQSPTTISIGRGYYSSHPISYGSEIGSETWIKNEHSAASMQRDISYAHGLDGEVNMMASDSSYTQDNSESGSTATTQMKIDENVTAGKVHIGVLQGSDASGQNMRNGWTDPLIEAWKNPAMQIDEDYIGTYHIYKNMTINSSYGQEKRIDSWLDCCSDGYFDINPRDSVFINADQVFNCKLNPKREYH